MSLIQMLGVALVCVCVCVCVSIPELVLERVLGADAGLSSSSWGPAAGQILGVPGPAGQVDRLLWRHWGGTK